MRPLLLASLFALPLVGCGDPVEKILDLDGNVADGETVFMDTCAECHAEDGTGGTGPDLTAEVPGLSDERIVEVIINGEDDMPAQDDLEDQEVADVLAYLRDTFTE